MISLNELPTTSNDVLSNFLGRHIYIFFTSQRLPSLKLTACRLPPKKLVLGRLLAFWVSPAICSIVNHFQTKASVPSVLIMLSSTGLFLGAWPCNAHAIKRLGSCSPLFTRQNHKGFWWYTGTPLKTEKKNMEATYRFQNHLNKQHLIISFVNILR